MNGAANDWTTFTSQDSRSARLASPDQLKSITADTNRARWPLPIFFVVMGMRVDLTAFGRLDVLGLAALHYFVTRSTGD